MIKYIALFGWLFSASVFYGQENSAAQLTLRIHETTEILSNIVADPHLNRQSITDGIGCIQSLKGVSLTAYPQDLADTVPVLLSAQKSRAFQKDVLQTLAAYGYSKEILLGYAKALDIKDSDVAKIALAKLDEKSKQDRQVLLPDILPLLTNYFLTAVYEEAKRTDANFYSISNPRIREAVVFLASIQDEQAGEALWSAVLYGHPSAAYAFGHYVTVQGAETRGIILDQIESALAAYKEKGSDDSLSPLYANKAGFLTQLLVRKPGTDKFDRFAASEWDQVDSLTDAEKNGLNDRLAACLKDELQILSGQSWERGARVVGPISDQYFPFCIAKLGKKRAEPLLPLACAALQLLVTRPQDKDAVCNAVKASVASSAYP